LEESKGIVQDLRGSLKSFVLIPSQGTFMIYVLVPEGSSSRIHY